MLRMLAESSSFLEGLDFESLADESSSWRATFLDGGDFGISGTEIISWPGSITVNGNQQIVETFNDRTIHSLVDSLASS